MVRLFIYIEKVGKSMMYRVYQLTDKEKDKITKLRWDGDTHYYDVFESQEECDEEEKRLAKIEEDCRRQKEAYLKIGHEK